MEQEVTPIRILDMGCGDGGRYISNHNESSSYVLVDRRLDQSLAAKYPNSFCVVANVQCLPFRDGAFNKLETRFPYGTLLCPGLQRITSEGLTWYPEFARVLQEGGTLTIWADIPWISTRQVAIDSNQYFEVISIDEKVTRKELEEMGSFGCSMWSRKMKDNSQDESDRVKKIILKKIKL